MSCWFCKEEGEYSSPYFKIYRKKNHAPNKNYSVFVKWTGCPPFSDCIQKERTIQTVFDFNFCPNCGEKLNRNFEV